MFVLVALCSALASLCTHAVRVSDADEARVTAEQLALDCAMTKSPACAGSVDQFHSHYAGSGKPAEKAVVEPASARATSLPTMPPPAGALIALRSEDNGGLSSNVLLFGYLGCTAVFAVVLVYGLATRLATSQGDATLDGSSEGVEENVGEKKTKKNEQRSSYEDMKNKKLGDKEPRFFEVVDAQYVDSERRPFPHSLGPFTLKMTETIRPEDFSITVSTRKESTWVLEVGMAHHSESVHRAAPTLQHSANTIHGRMSPVHAIGMLNPAAKIEIGIPESAKHFAWSHAAVHEAGIGAFFVIPDVVQVASTGLDSDEDDDDIDAKEDTEEEDEEVTEKLRSTTTDDGRFQIKMVDDEDGDDGPRLQAAPTQKVVFDPDLAFLHHGGYVYFDADFKAVCILALLPDPLGTLCFGPPQKWIPGWNARFKDGERFQPVTLPALKSCGARMVSWIFPDEVVEGTPGSSEAVHICPRGGFAYLFG